MNSIAAPERGLFKEDKHKVHNETSVQHHSSLKCQPTDRNTNCHSTKHKALTISRYLKTFSRKHHVTRKNSHQTETSIQSHSTSEKNMYTKNHLISAKTSGSIVNSGTACTIRQGNITEDHSSSTAAWKTTAPTNKNGQQKLLSIRPLNLLWSLQNRRTRPSGILQIQQLHRTYSRHRTLRTRHHRRK